MKSEISIPAPDDYSAHIQKRFSYHRPIGTQPERYELLRREALKFAALIETLVPTSGEQNRAIDKLDEAVMIANAGIARNELG